MTLQDFVNKWNGKSIDYDGAFGPQCVDLIREYIKEVWGTPQPPSVKGAYQLLDNLPASYEVFYSGEIKPGDIIVWNKNYGDKGHTAVVLQSNPQQFQCFEQNNPVGSKCHSAWHNYGSIRGWFRPKPMTQYPIQIPIMLLMNKQPVWQSLLKRMAELQNWYWENSGHKIQLIIDYKDVSFTNFPTGYTGSGTGDIYEIIDPTWFKNNIVPLTTSLPVFVVRKQDFKGGVATGPGTEVGYCYTPVSNFRGIFVAMDENDDYPPAIDGLWGLSKIVAHEISHHLYKIGLNTKEPTGGRTYTLGEGFDLTHNHYFGQNGSPQRFADIFQDFDFDKINLNK